MQDYKYKTPQKLAFGSMILIGITLLFSAASFYGSVTEWSIYGQYDPERSFNSLSAVHKEKLTFIVAGIDLLKTLSFLISISMFLVWTYRVHRNGLALKLNNVVNAPGWSVTVYFIPIVNMLMPLISLIHLHKNGIKKAEELGYYPRAKTWLLYSWWILFWSSYLVSLPANFGSENDSIGQLRDQIPFFMVSEVLYFLSGLFLMFVIKKVSAVQELINEGRKG